MKLFTPLRGKVRRHRHETDAQQKRRIARFSRLTLPKTPLRTVFYSVFMLCEAETTANSDVVELAVAQNTAIYSVFESAIKKHRKLRRFQQHGRQKHCYLRGFLHFRAKNSSLGNVERRCKNHCFCTTKTAKAVTQTAPKSQILPPGLPTRHMEKIHVSKPKTYEQKSKPT